MTTSIALTPGEPAGIGPDLTVMLAQQARKSRIVAIADRTVLQERAERLKLPLQIRDFQPDKQDPVTGHHAGEIIDQPGELYVQHVPVHSPVTCGQLNPRNGRYVLATLDAAVDGCMHGQYGAMVTAPLHKGVINDAGIPFTGHTEYLAERTHSEPVMMLATETPDGPLRVALATTHLPLAAVPAALTADVLRRALQILHADLVRQFGITQPRILVAGLNPHAGESGHMGREEIDVIEPVLAELRASGMHLTGPLPADTLFTPQHLQHADAVMAMFHDQGLPVLKYAGFGKAINITLGLPIIRTSVDHGTALDKAGSGDINCGSLDCRHRIGHSTGGIATGSRQHVNHRARKRFGQNFLQDMGIIERMLAAMRPEANDAVVEVGPGLGALTLPLLDRLDRLAVVEIDRDLIERLEAQNLDALSIYAGDVMKFDFTALATELAEGGASEHSLRVVGNLPYNIGTPLLIRLLDCHEQIRDVHVMLQKEVVDRLHANPGTRAFGRLSVLIQSVFHVTPLFSVPPESFDPSPKVQSAVVRLIPRDDAPDVAALTALQYCTRLAFASKRKTLRNNFKGYLDEAALESLQINPQARAETLDLEAFYRMAKRLSELPAVLK